MPNPMSASPTRPDTARRMLPAVLLLLTVFGPISMDLYLPVLPALTLELGAVTSMGQLTVTACLVGLALGQLIAGRLSDRFGRRMPLLIGVVAFIVTSAWCAIAPSVEMLIIARVFLAATGAVILLAVTLQFTETLPAERRTRGWFAQIARDYHALLGDRRFVGAVLASGLAYAALFAYLAGATYVLQGIYGLTPQQYALAFGLNSAGFMAFGWLAARSSQRWSLHATLVSGLAMCGAGSLGLLLGGLVAVPVSVVIVSLFLLVGGVAVTTPPTTTIALADHPRMAGIASSLLGMARFALGGVVAPLVGIAGAATMLPLGIVAVAAIALAAASVALLGPRQHHGNDPAATDPEPAAALTPSAR
ncbi:MFS transporter [Agromyces bauzanensis]